MFLNRVIGIDIGGTTTKFGLVDEAGQILAQASIPTCENSDPEHFASRLAKGVEQLLASIGSKALAVGVGAPNANFYKGQIEYAPNLLWKGIVPMVSILERHIKLPVKMTNDANAAAIGEMKFGGAKGMRDFIAITLGTGLGSGIVVNGELLHGHSGFAGELGHANVVRDGRLCGCGRRGCLETYASATGVVTTAREVLANTSLLSVLRDRALSAHLIASAATEGDRVAIEIFKRTGEILGAALANAALITSPEAIFLMGGLAKSGDCLMNPVIESFERDLLNVFKGTIKILPSGLPESDAAILGAAALA